MDTASSQIQSTESVQVASGSSGAIDGNANSNPFINSVFTCNRGNAQGEYFDTIPPKSAGKTFFYTC